MIFNDFFLVFFEYTELNLSRANAFIALFNILVNGTPDKNDNNPFSELLKTKENNTPNRLYDQYRLTEGYQFSKYKSILKNARQENISTFVDNLPDDAKKSIDCRIRDELEFYRDNIIEGKRVGELSVGQAFARILMKFIEQRTKKMDPGVERYYPYASETEAVIVKLKSICESTCYNLLILQPNGLNCGNSIKLSRLNAPRACLCKPFIKLNNDEEWLGNLAKLKSLTLLIESGYSEEKSKKEENLEREKYAYIGYIYGEPLVINCEDIVITYHKIAKILLKDLLYARELFGITGSREHRFFFGCHEGSEIDDYKGCDGYWEPDDAEFFSDAEPHLVNLDEFMIHPIALPMWVIKTVNLAMALELSNINVEFCD